MRILVPTDFSAASQSAVKAAVELARLCNAEVVIHHAYTLKLDWSKLAMQPTREERHTLSNKEQARAVLDHIVKRHPDVAIQARLSEYETIEELLEQAQRSKTTLMIVGTRGEGELANRLLGSDTQRMVRLAHCPVIVLPEARTTFPFHRILFVSDLTEDFSPQLANLLKLANCMKAEVHLGFVNSPMDFQCSNETEKQFDQMRERFPDTLLPGHIFNHVRVDRGIQLMAESVGADAIALVTHNRWALQRFFYSSLTEKIALSSDLPIIGFHQKP